MAQWRSLTVVFLGLLVFCAAAEAKKERKLGYYRGGSGGAPSGSSPVSQTPSAPYGGSTPSGSSPVIQNPTPSSPYGSTPSSSSPVVQVPPVTPSPSTSSPVTIPPVSQTPSGGNGGYGSRSGKGSCRFWGSNPGRVPRVLSLVSSLARLFGPRLLRVFSNRPTILSALKDENTDPMPSLAREASASLINAYAYNDFPLRAADVVAQFNSALDSPQLAASQAQKFRQFNEDV